MWGGKEVQTTEVLRRDASNWGSTGVVGKHSRGVIPPSLSGYLTHEECIAELLQSRPRPPPVR